VTPDPQLRHLPLISAMSRLGVMVEVQKFWVKPNAQHSNAKAKSKGRAKMSKERNKKVQQNSQAKQKKEKAQQNSKAKQKHSFVF